MSDTNCSPFMKSESACSHSLRVVDLVLVLLGGAGVWRRRLPEDRCRYVAVVLVVVGQRQVQQAGAGGQVDVLHVLHLRPTHGTQLVEGRHKKPLSATVICKES